MLISGASKQISSDFGMLKKLFFWVSGLINWFTAFWTRFLFSLVYNMPEPHCRLIVIKHGPLALWRATIYDALNFKV